MTGASYSFAFASTLDLERGKEAAEDAGLQVVDVQESGFTARSSPCTRTNCTSLLLRNEGKNESARASVTFAHPGQQAYGSLEEAWDASERLCREHEEDAVRVMAQIERSLNIRHASGPDCTTAPQAGP